MNELRFVPADTEERYARLFEQLAVGIVEADSSGRILVANSCFCEMLGFTAEELKGREIATLTHPGDVHLTHDRHARLAGGDFSHSVVDKRYVRKDGTIFWATTDVSIITDPDTGAHGFFGVILDIDARKKAEDAVRESEAKYRLLLERSADSIFVSDRNHRYIEVNSRACELTGFSREKLLEMTILDLIAPEDLAGVPFQAPLVAPGESFLIERRLRTSDGSTVEVEISATTLPDGRLLASVRDITKRKRIEDNLRTSERRFEMVVHATQDAVYDLDLETGNVWRSATFWTMFGPSDATFEWFQSRVHPSDVAGTLRSLEEAIAGRGDLWSAEYRLRKQDGDYAAIVDRGSILRDPDGKARRIIGTMMDVTDRRKSEQALRLNEERFRAMIENAHDVISIVDASGVSSYKSPSEQTVFGYAPEEVVGTTGFDRIHPEDVARVREIFIQGLSQPGSTSRAQYRYLHKDGTWREVEAVGSNLLYHPAVRGVVLTTRDITERKKIQAQLEQAQRLSSLGRLAATVAHEFNNVLMGIQPFAEVIRRVAPDEPRLTTAADQISRSIARGKRITQEILRFTQPAQPAMTTVSIAKWLSEAESELSALISPKCQLELILPETDLDVSADAGQLMQVVTNLVLNGRDAMPGGGSITIRMAPASGEMVYPFGVVPDPGEYVHMSIADTGSGIPREIVDRVWEPLFTTKKSGTGLGLPVARQIVDRHGGHIFVESTPGVGTTFHIFLPRSRKKTSSRSAPSAARPLRILIVEDEIAVAHGIEMLLQAGGHDVRHVGLGSHALIVLPEFQPDVVILDVALPDMNGIDVCRQLLELRPQTAVIFSTAHGDRRALESLPRGAAIDFLQKPYELESLTGAIDRVLA